MYYIKKRLEVSASHRLELDYESPCQNIHGHNWIIYVYCKMADQEVESSKNGMVIDFKKIKEIVHGTMDHKFLNDVFPFNPTAENIARWIVFSVPYCYKAKVIESESNEAIYEAV